MGGRGCTIIIPRLFLLFRSSFRIIILASIRVLGLRITSNSNSNSSSGVISTMDLHRLEEEGGVRRVLVRVLRVRPRVVRLGVRGLRRVLRV